MKKLFFITCLIVLIKFSFGQSCTDVKELLRKRHTISGMTYGHPYTMFDRHNPNFKNLENAIKNIRENIKKDSILGQAYYTIYTNATSTMPNDNGINNGDHYSALAYWAKNNAFVFLVGMDASGNLLDTNNYSASRDSFRDRALNAFTNLVGVVTPHEPGTIYIWNSDDDKMQHYSRSLIYWLQAYDLLKAAYELRAELDSITPHRYPWGFADADRNSDGSCAPRRKLRNFARNIYTRSKDFDGIVEHATGWKQNHGIACASALLMAAQVLNDAGTETNFFTAIWDWFGDLIGEDNGVEFAPYYSPVNWNELGQGGLEENLFVGNHWWLLSEDVPQSFYQPRGENIDYNVYAEGPGYAYYGLFDCGIPAMITQRNLYPSWSSEPFLKHPTILGIFNWYDRIQTDDNMQPSYDNSGNGKNNILGITGIPHFNRGIEGIGPHLSADYVAIVGGNNIPLNTEKRKEFDVMEKSGNVILRNRTDSAKHTFHMLFESGTAVNKEATSADGTHEDDDMGSFLIYVGDKNANESTPLAIDPPYFGWNFSTQYNANATSFYWMHNTIEIDDGNDARDRVYKYPKFNVIDDGKNTKIQKFSLAFDFKNEDHTLFGNAITRNVNAINKDNNLYYFINDYVNVDGIGPEDGSYQYINLNLNGNGNKFINDNSGKPTFRKEKSGDSLFRWTFPCMSDYNNWGLTAHFSVLNNNTIDKGSWEEPYTNDSYYHDGSKGEGISDGTHTKLIIHQPTKKTIFQSFLYPQKCNWALPTVTKHETENYVSTIIRFINSVNTDSITASMGKNGNPNQYINDTASHFHFARWEGNISDSITNPFNIPAQANIKLYLNAQKAFIKHHTYGKNIQGYKYCPASYANIKYLSFDNGSYLQFNDTFLIKSPILINAYLGFQSRHAYIAQIKPLATNSTTDSIEIYLADVGRGKDMVALINLLDTVPGRYDSLTRILHLAVPTTAISFMINEKQNCINCYFPPTWLNIQDTFDANDGYSKIDLYFSIV